MITETTPSPLIQPGSLFFKVFRNSPVGMVIIDAAEGIYIDANDAFAELVGYTREELLHAPILPSAFDIDMEPEAILDILRHVRRLADIPVTLTSRDGATRSIIFSIQWEEIDGAAYFYIIAQDYSRQARAKIALQQSENRIRHFYTSIPLPLLVIDEATGRILDINPAASELYGYTRNEFLALTFTDLAPFGPADAALPPTGARVGDSVFCRHRLKNGTIVEVDIATYSFVLDGRPARLSVIQDVTEKQALQKELEQSEERLRIIAGMTADAIWELDLTRDKVKWSAGLSTLNGYPAEIAGGYDWWHSHIHPEDRDFIRDSLDRTLASDSSYWSGQYRFRRVDGSYATVLDSGYIMRGKRDTPINLIGSMVDITEQLQLAEVASRAALEERQRLAHDLHDTVTQSLYSVSLLAEASRRRSDTDEREVLKEYIDRLGELTMQTLRQMRLLVYELRPDVLEQEGLAGALRHRLEAVEHRAGIRATLIDETAGPIPPNLKHDLFWIAQEALNNSLKHASATTVRVLLRHESSGRGAVRRLVRQGMRRGGRARTYLVLEVSDNGAGFDEASLEHAGGLSAIRRRVLELGGTLTMKTERQSGTTIQVRLPE